MCSPRWNRLCHQRAAGPCDLPLGWSCCPGSCKAQQGAGHTTQSCLHHPRRLPLLSSAWPQSSKSHFSIVRSDGRGAGWALAAAAGCCTDRWLPSTPLKANISSLLRIPASSRVGQIQRFWPSLFLSCFRNMTFSHSSGNSFLES